jgi:hypothetical protein
MVGFLDQQQAQTQLQHAWGCACYGCASPVWLSRTGSGAGMGAVDPALLQQGIASSTEIVSAILAARAARKAQEAAAGSGMSWAPQAPVSAASVPVQVQAPAAVPASSLPPLAIFAGGLLVALAGGAFLLRDRSRRGQ